VPSFETRLLIKGEQVEGTGPVLEVENPFTEETVAPVHTAGGEQIDAAISGAREASRDWGRTPAVDRGELLREVATRLRDSTDQLAEVMTLEGGKPLVENSDEVGWTAACFDYTPRSVATRRAVSSPRSSRASSRWS
jgi:acyl-CoA reductase-like NAD-dependent aldehyde dehydrogenase